MPSSIRPSAFALDTPLTAARAGGRARWRIWAARGAWLGAVALAAWPGLAVPAGVFTVSSFTPQGEVARVRQITAKFSENMVAFGDPKAAAPFTVSCDDASASKGQGRWTSAREWVYDFDADLPPGLRCQTVAASGLQSVSGADLKGASSYRFNTGGPYVQHVDSGEGRIIEEEQVFVLRLNGPATTESVQQNVWCVADGLGERVPVKLLAGDERAALLKAKGMDDAAQKAPLRYHALRCNRRLTPDSRVQLVFGAGVSTPSGVANRTERRFSYDVRKPFTANLTCERENAQAACMPIRPITLSFSASVSRRVAEQARLRSDKAEYKPVPSDDPDLDALVESVSFPAPLPERTSLTLTVPADLKDASGRPLSNAASFPLKTGTGPMPPLAKFAAAPFGIVERFAEGPDGPALMPLTLRYVEPALKAQALQISKLQPQSDADIITWYRRVRDVDENSISRDVAKRLARGPLPKPFPNDDTSKEVVESRAISLIQGLPSVETLDVPGRAEGDERPFEVVGVPLKPGFHVLELASKRLGTALLDGRYGDNRPMYVRTAVLVTNLAVHFKRAREGDALAWVTTLDKGKPVPGAVVRVSDCMGNPLAEARTDEQGLARLSKLPTDEARCRDEVNQSTYSSRDLFISARAGEGAQQELAFTWSDWQRGIEPWRFNVPTNNDASPTVRAHTVFDRTLLRAGQTVSMKHFLRTETANGFGLPKHSPGTLVITHMGSGQEFTQPLHWRSTSTGGRSAESSFALPPAARLGVYAVTLRTDNRKSEDHIPLLPSGQFRVEEFRLPVLQGQIGPESKDPLVAATTVPLQMQINYVAGGPAGGLPVRVSALTSDKPVAFDGYEGYSFDPPRPARGSAAQGDGEEEASASSDQRVVADKLAVTLGANGSGKLTLNDLKAAPRPQNLKIEATFADPNGEIQTLSHTTTLWPAAVLAGIKADGWVSAGNSVKLTALALDLKGQPKAGVPMDVRAVARITTSSRKRMVGGFYTYDNRTETKDLGTVCTGSSDARGLLVCDAKLSEPGEVELIATARDSQARTAQASGTVWVTRQGELWFGGENHDRMDVLPEKKTYQPGETARFQVRMPFRYATALVAVEREGVISTQVMELRGDNPTVELKVDEHWGPNVYVSVLALRGRLREVPWYSFFTWGYKAPSEWWRAFWHESKDYVAATPLVDLSKPAFRLGMAEIRVGTAAHQLAVDVKADKVSYPVRAKAQVTITVKRPDGQPAAGAEVALAAVDQALLELSPNTSWKLLEAMLQRRAWGVETATAQMEIVGRRHYGRKAVPTGGDGGGKNATRELLDTLLLWNPRVVLNEQGQAQIEVPLNDALTTFQIVAVADAGTGLFGTGQAAVRVTQDLQIISGLPPLVREGDQFRALITLRNTTAQAMKVEATPRATLLQLTPQTVEIPAGEARELQWDVTAPAQLAHTRVGELLWEIEARDTLSKTRDALKVSQRIVPAVPLTVQQATLTQVDGRFELAVAPPANALALQPGDASSPRRGGLQMALQPKLAEGLPGVRDWFARYPYSCLEQKTSKSIGLRDMKLWQQTVAQLPTYLDSDGLAYYFPPRTDQVNQGSDTLTAWLLAVTHEASQIDKGYALPDDARAHMIAGLTAFVNGKVERKHWSPRDDLTARKLAAIEALARHNAATPGMLTSLTMAPNQWPTSAVIDWISILQRLPKVPDQPKLLAEAQQILRARLSTQGTRLIFSTENEDRWWWLMAGGDVNAARLLLLVVNDPAWKDDVPRLVTGFIERQKGGAWSTTTANLWGGLALERFSKVHESAPVNGSTRATLGGASAEVDWAKVKRLDADSAGKAQGTSGFDAPPAPGMLTHNTMHLPWGDARPGAAEPLVVTHSGSGKPWLTLQSVAALQLTEPQSSGYQIKRTVTAVEQADKALPAGHYSRGDVLRVKLEINASAPMTWVAVTDPVPGGSTLLGSGLGRDSAIATLGEKLGGGVASPDFVERSFEAWRGYFSYLPKGNTQLEYTVRLNNPGTFQLPPSRVEALYAPEMFGVTPNAPVTVKMP